MFKKIIVLLVLITSIVLSQSWNDIKTTNINLENANYAEMFSNSFGNNVILQNTNGSISYYLVNASTGLAGNAITVETSGASLAQITGEAQKVYVLYKKNNKIVGKFSTNAGVSWSPLNQEVNVSVSSLDAVAYDGRIHITYSSNNIAYYYQYFNGSWINNFNVSNSGTGLSPRIEMLTTQSKVYVVFNSSSGSAKSRELTLPSSWGDIKTLYSNVNQPKVAGFGVDANYMYLYYSDLYNISPYFYYTFHTNIIQKSNYQTISYLYESYNYTDFVQTTTTSDNKVHTAFTWFGILGNGYQTLPYEPGLVIETWNNGNIEGENVEVNYNYEYYYNVEVSSASNDIFVLWKPQNSSTLKYRQYDAIPLAPQNLAVQIYTLGSETYPKLIWSFNNEPDVYIKTNAYQVWRRYSLSGGAWSAWTIIGYSDGNESEYIDYSISGLYAESNTAEYKLRVRDYTNQFSDFSSAVSINFSQFNIYKLNNGIVQFGYELDQNYPNPFNPNTKISFSIKEEGLVTLKVYDILGKEVATLVNENKPEGIYEADFDASTLPSGMYIYKLQAGSFTDVKKMLLTK